MKSFKEKVIRGLAWNFLNVFFKHGLSLIIHIVLARLLIPEDFGVIGMISIFIQLSLRLQGAGLGESLLRKKQTNQEEYNFVFFYGIFLGLFMYLIFYWTAPWIARFYAEPKLVWATRLITLNLIIIPLSGINRIHLVKELEFNKIAITEICASILSGAIAIILAYKGYGYMSLVIQNISLYFFSMILLISFSRWLPTLSIHWKQSIELFSFGSQLMVANFLQVGFKNIYNVMIGKYYSATDLGLYMQGMKLQRIPSEAIGTVIKNVSFPAFAQIQEDRKRYKKIFRNAIGLLTFISFPLMTVFVVTADPLIPLLLSEKWRGAIPFFQMLAVVGFMEPVKSLFVTLFKVSGRADRLIKTILVTKIFFLIGILVTFKINLYALVISQVIATVLELAFFARIGKEIQYNFMEFLSDLLPNFITAIMLGTVLTFFNRLTNFESVISIFLCYGLASFSFFSIAYITKNPNLHKIWAEIRKRFK